MGVDLGGPDGLVESGKLGSYHTQFWGTLFGAWGRGLGLGGLLGTGIPYQPGNDSRFKTSNAIIEDLCAFSLQRARYRP